MSNLKKRKRTRKLRARKMRTGKKVKAVNVVFTEK